MGGEGAGERIMLCLRNRGEDKTVLDPLEGSGVQISKVRRGIFLFAYLHFSEKLHRPTLSARIGRPGATLPGMGSLPCA